MQRPRIVCLASHYLPGFKAGGPIKSLAGLCERLQGDFDFYVITRDRDLGDLESYKGLQQNKWYQTRGAKTWYLSRPYWWPAHIHRPLRTTVADLIYFQSLFDPCLSIVPLLFAKARWPFKKVSLLIAPRGELSPGALSIKRHKKRLYLTIAKTLGVYRSVCWHATSEGERDDIYRWFGADARVFLAPNLAAPVSADVNRVSIKKAGEIRIVFFSRISRKKNLDGALRILQALQCQVTFDIFGTREDAAYWEECESLLRKLPSNVTARYCGHLLPSDVVATMARYDIFLFPTRGENFGHVVLESMIAGTPVLISDTTPWQALQHEHAGIVVSLGNLEGYRDAIEGFARMNASEFSKWSVGARKMGLAYSQNKEWESATRRMLSVASNAGCPEDM
jgi:glycosyltransferase involved in cell wall biosynthesis